MGVGVEGGILPRLHRYLGEGGCRRAVVLHVPAGAKGVAGHHVVAADVPLRRVLSGDGNRAARHLLGTEGQGHIVEAGGDAPIGLPERRRSAGAGIFHVDDGDASQPQFGQGGLAQGHSVVVDVPEVGYGNVFPAHPASLSDSTAASRARSPMSLSRNRPKGCRPTPATTTSRPGRSCATVMTSDECCDPLGSSYAGCAPSIAGRHL